MKTGTPSGLFKAFFDGPGMALMNAANSPDADLVEIVMTCESIANYVNGIKTTAQLRALSQGNPKEELTPSPSQQHPPVPEPPPAQAEKSTHFVPMKEPRSVQDRWRDELRTLNQHEVSRAREIEILRILHSAIGKGVTLNELMLRLETAHLAQAGQRNAVVTQLNRLKKDKKLIASPYDGVYELLPEGKDHLERYMKAFPKLLVPDPLRYAGPTIVGGRATE